MRDNDRIIELLANHQVAARKLLIDLATAEASPSTLSCVTRAMYEIEGALTGDAQPYHGEIRSELVVGQVTPINPYLPPEYVTQLQEMMRREVESALREVRP